TEPLILSIFVDNIGKKPMVPQIMAINFKQLVSNKLSYDQKYLLRNLINFRVLSPPFSKSLVLILGCQRSGTTLTLLMLQAHPQIKGYDESHCHSPFPFPHSASLIYHY
ncbi:MAG: sulfotransferase, partial [Crocosphaera sp.]